MPENGSDRAKEQSAATIAQPMCMGAGHPRRPAGRLDPQSGDGVYALWVVFLEFFQNRLFFIPISPNLACRNTHNSFWNDFGSFQTR